MLWDILKDERFSVMFSFILGVGILAVFRPACDNDSCAKVKAPPIPDFDDKTFRIGDACYKFKTKTRDCPAEGFIESFAHNNSQRIAIQSRQKLRNLQCLGITQY
jgi:hypothetical protein